MGEQTKFELLCYNDRFKDYKGFYGIETDLIKKNNVNFV